MIDEDSRTAQARDVFLLGEIRTSSSSAEGLSPGGATSNGRPPFLTASEQLPLSFDSPRVSRVASRTPPNSRRKKEEFVKEEQRNC